MPAAIPLRSFRPISTKNPSAGVWVGYGVGILGIFLIWTLIIIRIEQTDEANGPYPATSLSDMPGQVEQQT